MYLIGTQKWVTEVQFKRMPFGLKNRPSIFQRIMQGVLAPFLWLFALVYIDDYPQGKGSSYNGPHSPHVHIRLTEIPGNGRRLLDIHTILLDDRCTAV